MWCLPTDEKEKLSETETEQSEQEQEEEKNGAKMYNQIAVPQSNYYKNIQTYINFSEGFPFT